MADEEGRTRQWIVEPPPAAGEVSIYLAVGEGVDLTAEQQAALEALLRTLEMGDAEVVGHAGSCGDLITDCDPLTCHKVNCSSLDCGLNKPKSSLTSLGGQSWALMGSFGPASL
jgi:hypothetical protein